MVFVNGMSKKMKRLIVAGVCLASTSGAGLFTAVHAQGPYYGNNGSQRWYQRQHAGDRDPRLQRALKLLTNARRQLQNADADSQGFRVKAIQECDEAIQDTRLAIQRDR